MPLMNRVFKLLSFLLLLPLCHACTEAELGGCKNAAVTLEYTADGTSDAFREHIANVAYYVYDANGKLVASGRLESADLSAFRGFKLKLEKGSYEVVCWGNLEHHCEARMHQQKETARIVNLAHVADADPQTGDPLYFGKEALEIKDSNTNTTVTIKFHAAHITLWMYTKGVVDVDANGNICSPVFHVGGFDSEYDFSGKSGGIPVSFRPESAYKEEKQVCMARCIVPRFSENTPAVLKVFKGSDHKLLEVVELSRFISDNQIEVEDKEQVTIPILFDFMGLDVVIRMPTWDEIEVSPEW